MKAIGIDLGTTNSVAACCDSDPRHPKVIPNSSGENLTPSVVSVRRPKRQDAKPEVLVGRAAVNYAPSARPEDTITSIKRLMGRDYGDAQIARVIERFHYEVVKGPNDDPRAHVRHNNEIHTPSYISSLILRAVKDDASRALGVPVTHSVITIPANFTESQRAATREAGEAAGLVVKKIIDEPTAAAIAFGVQQREGARHRILVYDLGGGTFDISILQMVRDEQGDEQFQVLETRGNNWLGGDDFDRQIVERLLRFVRDEYQDDLSGDRKFLQLAKQKAEEAKRVMSHATSVDIIIPAAYRSAAGDLVDVEMSLTRDEFNAIIQDFVSSSMSLVGLAMDSQGLTPDDISDVLLVGGATLTPLVYQTVENVFPGKVRRHINPMECVALGAAVLAATQQGIECPKCMAVNDETAESCVRVECGHSLASARAAGKTGIDEVTAMALGIAVVKGTQRDVFATIIPRGTPYPLREPMRQRFQATSGRRIVVPVYEGDKPVASQNAEQGMIEFELPDGIDANASVEVAFNYDRNRQLTVTISVPGHNLFKTETLRHDRPRAPRPTGAVAPEEEGDWREELERTVEFAEDFRRLYGNYIEPSQGMKLKTDFDRAQQLLAYPDEMEAKRMTRILQSDVFNSGLAAQLWLADRAVEGAAPEVAKQITDAVRAVRASHDRGDYQRAGEQARLLKVLVGKRLEELAGVQQLGDQEDFGGLLKALRD